MKNTGRNSSVGHAAYGTAQHAELPSQTVGDPQARTRHWRAYTPLAGVQGWSECVTGTLPLR